MKSSANNLQGKPISIVDVLKKQGLIFVFIFVLIGISCFYPAFLSPDNVLIIFLQVAVIGVLSCGETLVITGGNFDLSIGAIVSMSMVLTLSLIDRVGPTAAILAALAVCTAFGVINGLLVGYLRLNSFIITLGMTNIISALTLTYTKEVYVVSDTARFTWFHTLGNGKLLGIPNLVIMFLVIAAVFSALLGKSLLGRYISAVGGNRVASNYAGLRVEFTVLLTYVLCALTAGLAGIMLVARLGGTNGSDGAGLEFTVLTAVVLGGTSLTGGSGSVLLSVIGALMIGFINNGLTIIGLPYYSQWIVTSIIVVMAVWLDITMNRNR